MARGPGGRHHPRRPRVVVGPRGIDPARALAALGALVHAGGAVAAGSGADLGDGCVAARIEGGTGDRRDAVLAALAVPGFADRLGPPATVLVALFGPDATKPLGAAARDAVAARRWPVLRYAAAASDVLGPEQLVRLLALTAPDGVDPFPHGLPSVVGAQLARLLRGVPRPRRFRLLTSLWEQVCADRPARRRTARLRAGQVDRYDALRARYHRYEEDELRAQLPPADGRTDLLRVAVWRPGERYWLVRAYRVLDDALAATAFARLAVAVEDLGPGAGVARHRAELTAATADLDSHVTSRATAVMPGLTGLPARPGVQLAQILQQIRPDRPVDRRRAAFLADRLSLARAYGRLALNAADGTPPPRSPPPAPAAGGSRPRPTWTRRHPPSRWSRARATWPAPSPAPPSSPTSAGAFRPAASPGPAWSPGCSARRPSRRR